MVSGCRPPRPLCRRNSGEAPSVSFDTCAYLLFRTSGTIAEKKPKKKKRLEQQSLRVEEHDIDVYILDEQGTDFYFSFIFLFILLRVSLSLFLEMPLRHVCVEFPFYCRTLRTVILDTSVRFIAVEFMNVSAAIVGRLSIINAG